MTDTAETASGTSPYPDKWPRESGTPIVELYHTAIRRLVAERIAASGKPWKELVHDRASELTRADFEQIEADLLATGYRFEIEAYNRLVTTEDRIEGVRAFNEKRKPAFRGR